MRIYKNNMISIMLMIFICFSGASVLAETVFGSKDCGEWIRSPTDAKRQWLIGYMSGLSIMHTLNDRKSDPLEKINSADQIYLWMDNYCRKNPLNRVTLGGVELFLELMGK